MQLYRYTKANFMLLQNCIKYKTSKPQNFKVKVKTANRVYMYYDINQFLLMSKLHNLNI